MQNVTITIDKALAYELEIILRDRIQTLQSESKIYSNVVVAGIVQRQLNRAYTLHNEVTKSLDIDTISEAEECEDSDGRIFTRRS